MTWAVRAQGHEVYYLSPHLHLRLPRPSARTLNGSGEHLSTNSISHSTVLTGPPTLAWVPLWGAQHWLLRGRGHSRASATTQDQSPILLRGSRGSKWPGRKNEWPFPSPRPAVWRLASTGPYSPPRRTHKDQSEQHGGGTSEKRKEWESHRGRRKGRLKKAGRRRGGNRIGKREEPWALAHALVPGNESVNYAHLSLRL